MINRSSTVAGVNDGTVTGLGKLLNWSSFSWLQIIRNSAGSGTEKNVEAYAIAFNVNDNMSVSVALKMLSSTTLV